jgi:hypothetical protein
MDGLNNIPEPCARCQRRAAVNAAYAQDLIAADLRIRDLETDNGILRMFLQAALDRVAALTELVERQKAARDLRERTDPNYSQWLTTRHRVDVDVHRVECQQRDRRRSAAA